MDKNQTIVITLVSILLFFFCIFIALLLVIIFKNESLRDFLKNKLKRNRGDEPMSFDVFCQYLTSTLIKLSNDKIGALIAIERDFLLDQFIKLGYRLVSDFSPELLVSIFYNKRSPLHDGGVIVRDTKIVSISSYFPMTRQLLDVSYGARHRAAVGLSEKSDAIVFVISETTGNISVAMDGRIEHLSNSAELLCQQVVQRLGREE